MTGALSGRVSPVAREPRGPVTGTTTHAGRQDAMTERTPTAIRDEQTGAVLETVESYDGPSEVFIRRLGWRRLAEAADAHMKSGIEAVRAMGGAAVVKEFQALGGLEGARATAAKADPLASYDLGTLLAAGVVRVGGGEATREAIDALEPDLASAIARAILRRSRPGLFETEADQKNV